ncbi:polysaccharide deacetylase family protein [Algoriphagus sediminis]|uniref:Polysaccharide deacetylase family protein n=1 Tax=Algoriphagus sediminis TaxID=3057113 RepID=A0ABT7YDE3_9BACT|nr:polysaccharide deacetylase family protein [Algoriphagus sediminis]MDN3204548.1 polysaccharide deacetylase family protein [Algoriphagus sediminis]
MRIQIISFFFFLVSLGCVGQENCIKSYGGIIRMDTTKKEIYLVFTGGDFGEGLDTIQRTLEIENVRASFFFTGDFYRNSKYTSGIHSLIRSDHYLGAHSDKHLLYAAWENRDSLLVSREEFVEDIRMNYRVMKDFGIEKDQASFFMPPYEWYNDSISLWTSKEGLKLINFSPGTRSNADYTTPDMDERYVDSETIIQSILNFESQSSNGLNGFILLLHTGTDSKRSDKFYFRLQELIQKLKNRGYKFRRL